MGRHSAEPDSPPSTRSRPTPYGRRPFSLEELKARLEAELADFEARAQPAPRATAAAVMEHTADLTAEMSRLFDTDVFPALRFDDEPPLTDAGPLTDIGPRVRPGSDWLPSRFPGSDQINPSGPYGPGHRPGRGRDADHNRPHPYPVARPKPTPRAEPIAAEPIAAVPIAAVPIAAEPITAEPLVVRPTETTPSPFRSVQLPPSRAARSRHRSATSPRRPVVVRTPVLFAAALAAAVVSADQLDVLHTTPESAAATNGSLEHPSASLITVAGEPGQRVSRSFRRVSIGDDYVGEAVAPRTAPNRTLAKPKPTSTMKPGQTVPGTWVRPNNGPYNSCFCDRWGTFHEGIDLAGDLGSPIYAVGAGVVLEAGPASGFGNWVVIQHANGDVTIYGHMRYYYVYAGQHVTAGQEIAVVGEEGDVTGPHLHFGVRLGGIDGPYTDPVPWLTARGVSVGPYEPGM